MACLDMYNSEHNNHHHHHHHQCAPMSPRISFSNDFVDAQLQHSSSSRSETLSPSPVSSDFEFSVTNYSMMSADELFSKGRLLPFKDNNNNCNKKATTTLREELLVGDEEEDDDDDGGFQEFSLRPPKGSSGSSSSSSSTRWKGFLGLRKSRIGSKKVDKSSEASSETRSGLINERARPNLTSQELLNEGGSSCRNVEIGI